MFSTKRCVSQEVVLGALRDGRGSLEVLQKWHEEGNKVGQDGVDLNQRTPISDSD